MEVRRNANDSYEVLNKVSSLSCGYIHGICTSGDYKGLEVCDSEPWGSHALGALFLDGIMGGQKLAQPDVDFEELEKSKAMLINGKARINLGYQELLRGDHGDPELTSTNTVF